MRLPRGSGDGPAWSPDGRRLVFTVTVKRRAGQVEEVWVVRRNGKGLRRLRRGGDATWSSRGLIGYSEDGGAVATMRSNGRGRRIWVSQGSPVVVNELDFSSDGLKLVYQQGSLRATRNTIRTVDLRTGARTVFKDMTRDVTAYDVAWVPDSDRLAYVHSPSEGEDVSELRTIAPDGTGRETLFEFPSGLTPFGFAWQTR